jgi:ethanolamine ammonia-lyase large subunit
LTTASGAGAIAPRSRSAPLSYAHTIGGTRHVFADLRTLLARASPFHSGDALAGLAAASAAERVAAQMALADLPLRTLLS